MIQLENSSTFAIDYKINLDSLTGHKVENRAELPVFIERDQRHRFDIGPANFNGRSVFDCIPCEGTLEPGKQLAESFETFIFFYFLGTFQEISLIIVKMIFIVIFKELFPSKVKFPAK